MQAVLGVTVADDMDSSKSANSDFHDSPNTPSQLSFPHTPSSTALMPQGRQQHHHHTHHQHQLFPGTNPLLHNFPDIPYPDLAASLPPLVAPHGYRFPSVHSSGFLDLDPLGPVRNELRGHSRSNSMPLPLERAWEVTKLLEARNSEHLPPSFMPQVRHMHTPYQLRLEHHAAGHWHLL